MRLLLCALLLLPLSPARPRLLVLGDSIAYGLSATAEQRAFRHVLAASLGADLLFVRTTTVGDIPDPLPSVDYIVLEIGLNDAFQARMSEAAWQAAYGAALDKLGGAAPVVVAVTPFRALEESNPMFGVVGRYAQYIRQVAAAHDARLADLWSMSDCGAACRSSPSGGSAWPPWHGDGFHPNDAGHARIAMVMLRAIRREAIYLPVARF